MRAAGVFDQARLAPLAQLGMDATIILHPNGIPMAPKRISRYGRQACPP